MYGEGRVSTARTYTVRSHISKTRIRKLPVSRAINAKWLATPLFCVAAIICSISVTPCGCASNTGQVDHFLIPLIGAGSNQVCDTVRTMPCCNSSIVFPGILVGLYIVVPPSRYNVNS